MSANNKVLRAAWQGEEGWRIHHNDVIGIDLLTDGHGPTGYYDRIHIKFANGDKTVLPAHQCDGWEEKP